jgi:hypothetical protein
MRSAAAGVSEDEPAEPWHEHLTELLGEILAMDTEIKTKLEFAAGTQLPEPCHSRKPYESPQLQEWGSIVELTGGETQPPGDADGGGSAPS